MKRSMTALALVLMAGVGLRADVTVTSSTTISGPIAAMLGNAAPQMVMKIKGNRARMDMEMMGQSFSTIIDMETKQVTTLMHGTKTAQVVDASQFAANAAAAAAAAGSIPKMEAKVEATGRTDTVNGLKVSEYRYSMTLDMASLAANMGGRGGAGAMPPEAAEMMKDVKMILTGTMLVSKDGPGVAEYVAFTKAAQKSMISMMPMGGPGGSGPMPGFDDMMRAYSQLDGIPYQSEIETSFEGTGPMVDMMKSMGTMKFSSKVTDVSTHAIPDDQFTVPADYTVGKQQ